MSEFGDGWEVAEREETKNRRQHKVAMISGYRTLIERYETLGIEDRRADAQIVLARLLS